MSEVRRKRYWRAVEQIAGACVHLPNPDVGVAAVMGKSRLSLAQFRDAMDFSRHPAAYADWLGAQAELYGPSDWLAVQEQITFMSFRGDVLSRVADLREEQR